jgi:hAT family C-terminal dimerisation region
MDILPIQASSVPCERVFSSSKETTTPRRNKLEPNLVEALQLLKYDRKHGSTLDFTTGLDRDEELLELEEIEKLQPGDDLQSVISGFEKL